MTYSVNPLRVLISTRIKSSIEATSLVGVAYVILFSHLHLPNSCWTQPKRTHTLSLKCMDGLKQIRIKGAMTKHVLRFDKCAGLALIAPLNLLRYE